MTVCECVVSVSYTHLDVYKRQDGVVPSTLVTIILLKRVVPWRFNFNLLPSLLYFVLLLGVCVCCQVDLAFSSLVLVSGFHVGCCYLTVERQCMVWLVWLHCVVIGLSVSVFMPSGRIYVNLILSLIATNDRCYYQ